MSPVSTLFTSREGSAEKDESDTDSTNGFQSKPATSLVHPAPAAINPYVEPQYSSDSSSDLSDMSSSCSSDTSIEVEEDGDDQEHAYASDAYFVKDLDTGESYSVDEMDKRYELVTLDAVAEKRKAENPQSNGEKETTPSYLLSLYTADETADIEIEDHVDEGARVRSNNVALGDDNQLEPPRKCRYDGCEVLHQRSSGLCADHEIIAKENEDSRAQTEYLIPLGARAEFVRISGHGFVYDASSRVYTVYAIEMRCLQSSASWVVYRRYQEFKALNDSLTLSIRTPPFPPKKLIGSFDPRFIAKRQEDLSHWLRALLHSDGVDRTSPNPHLREEVREFLTQRADQPPFLLEQRLPVPSSKLFGLDSTASFHSSESKASLDDFEMIQVIGRGSFGKVVLVGHKQTKQLFAMKVLSKRNVVQRKQVEHTRTERRVLGKSTGHPFLVGLQYAFQTPQRLYLVLDYCPGGELFYHLSRMKKLPEHMACFYAAEVVLALEHLHGLGVVYRDLKPENILLTKDGHVKLADFGLAKEGIWKSVEGTNSLCGTPEYLPPEILDRRGHGTSVDWWNLGMVLYEMLTGLPPWYTNDRKRLFERLRTARLHFPPYVSRRAESFIRHLLVRNPEERLGSRGAKHVKRHPFFASIDWEQLSRREVEPPFRPCHTSMQEGEAPLNFEAEFTRLPLPSVEGGVGDGGVTVPVDKDAFKGFSFVNTSVLEDE